jgi:hypothetical protein
LWSFFATSPQAANEYANMMSGPKKGTELQGTVEGDIKAQKAKTNAAKHAASKARKTELKRLQEQ